MPIALCEQHFETIDGGSLRSWIDMLIRVEDNARLCVGRDGVIKTKPALKRTIHYQKVVARLLDGSV